MKSIKERVIALEMAIQRSMRERCSLEAEHKAIQEQCPHARTAQIVEGGPWLECLDCGKDLGEHD